MILQRAYFEDGQTEHVPLCVHLFHNLIIIGFTEVTGLFLEDNLKKIPFGVVP